MGSTITLKTLATELGVSTTTVSNAYSKPDRLSAELRQRILDKADELGYCGPSAAGRALRSGKTDVCGFLFGGDLSSAFADPYSVIFLGGLTRTLEQYGASVLLLRAPEEREAEGQLFQRAAIDSIVLCASTEGHPGLDVLRQRGVRVIATQRSEGDWVAINDTKAGRLIGKHLDRLGHRKVVVIAPGCIPPGEEVMEFGASELDAFPSSYGYDRERLNGLAEKMPGAEIRVVIAGPNTREAGRAAAGYVLDDQDRPTAIVALSDVLALGVWDAVADRGLKPGRDISLSGFDDLPDAGFLGITTIRQPIARKGELAGRLAMDPDYPERQITLPIELVVRASTGPAPRHVK
ncbi:MAG: LacI family DNA-binding transcriptional regulator [Propionibacteriaceae bacterium]|jgi:DNA-binding LacI/PurR family transcriptional regulator|nr:LacI family DNA-binding transcriptional regulator [Propionibacteriaceae bacterium]